MNAAAAWSKGLTGAGVGVAIIDSGIAAEYSYAAAWQYRGEGQAPELHKEPLHFDYVHPSQRSYK